MVVVVAPGLYMRLIKSVLPRSSLVVPPVSNQKSYHFRSLLPKIHSYDLPSHPLLYFQLARQVSRSPYFLTSETIGAGSTNNEDEIANEEVESSVAEEQEEAGVKSMDVAGLVRNTEKDRTKVISFETSMRYIKSDAYKQSYGEDPVWTLYRRNFKGQFAPKKTRKTCIRGGMIAAGNPCPICRDEYLVLDYRNVDLLKQFISPHNGEILSYSKTGLCQKRHLELLIEILKSKDYGTITFDVPFREYEYSEYVHLYRS